ncbi:MAG: hypothetical protein Q9M89_04125 [Persephonella sp.]|nr:hypothetical protein [Persephonella sp.]
MIYLNDPNAEMINFYNRGLLNSINFWAQEKLREKWYKQKLNDEIKRQKELLKYKQELEKANKERIFKRATWRANTRNKQSGQHF